MAKVAGPILSIAGIVIDGVQMNQDDKAALVYDKVQKALHGHFIGIANSLDEEFNRKIKQVTDQYFNPIEHEVMKERSHEEKLSRVLTVERKISLYY